MTFLGEILSTALLECSLNESTSRIEFAWGKIYSIDYNFIHGCVIHNRKITTVIF